LTVLIDETREHAGVFGLIYLDLDKFKLVNDRYGHRVGDLYLQEVAHRMKGQLRTQDMLARLGGDEFAVLVPAVRSRGQVEEIAQRLGHSLDEQITIEGSPIDGAVSFGIALYPADGSSSDTLVRAADAAMYRAKRAKRSIGWMGSPAL
jgi:diguanylate cyclase (GGDEF)-like protein